ncbi:MAG TPA: hypothetical protein VMT64_10385, partial [Candidatus Binataceae bacterium]|nr:hypothetical protein [Candidatus Binataceae bacterium]
RESALRAIARSIIVYPTPHWAPQEYQVDVIMEDDVTPAAFDETIRTIRRSLGGRTFGLAGTNVQLTLIPRRAFEHPWFFLGTPFPFLHEHVAAFAETLFGLPPRIPAPPPREERIRWCAQYFLFHRFTLHYRPRYIAKDCNFSQLAALRIFLEKGEVLSEASQVRDAFLKGSAGKSPALNFLLPMNGCAASEMPLADALEAQAREYEACENLLRREGVRHKVLDSNPIFGQT